MRRSIGQIIERGPNHFLVRVFMGEDGTGKRKYANTVVRGPKSEAKKTRNAMVRDRDLGRLSAPSSRTLNQYLDEWLEVAAKPRVQPATFRLYETQLQRYVRGPLGGLKLTTITPVAIQRLYGAMLAKDLSSRTIRLTHAILWNSLKQAVKWRYLALNPADEVDLPLHQRQEMTAMTEGEASRYLAAAASSRHHVLLASLLSIGLRPSEALALRWSDLDLAGARLSVQRKVTHVGSKWVYGPPKTAKGRRAVDLPHGTCLLLTDHPRIGTLVFDNGDGVPPGMRGVVKEHKAVLTRARLNPNLRLYDLRHTHATLLLIAGVHPKIVSERLGHSTIAITLDTYSHVLQGMQQESARRLDAMLFSREPQEEVAFRN